MSSYFVKQEKVFSEKVNLCKHQKFDFSRVECLLCATSTNRSRALKIVFVITYANYENTHSVYAQTY